jgi:predicted nucleic acid-binding protein
MGSVTLLDTNVAIRLLRGDPETVAILTGRALGISVISKIELLAWPGADENALAAIASFVNDLAVLELSDPIAIRTAEIRRGKLLKLPDAIIAATALVNNIPLATGDSDFRRVDGLQIV